MKDENLLGLALLNDPRTLSTRPSRRSRFPSIVVVAVGELGVPVTCWAWQLSCDAAFSNWSE